MSNRISSQTKETDRKMVFFAVVPPGLEKLAQTELAGVLSPASMVVHSGGLEWLGEIEPIRQIQSRLRIPTRILVRVAEIPARDFVKWYKKCLKIPWADFLQEGQGISVEASRVSSHGSRLRIKKRIAQTLLEAFRKARVTTPGMPEAQIWIRFMDDVATVSMDLGGGRLDRRTEGKWVGKAPMRENLVAAALLALAKAPTSRAEEDRYLVDPMAGSGTALLEARIGSDSLSWKGGLALESDAHAFAALKQNLGRTQAVELLPVEISDPNISGRLASLNGALDVFCNAPYGVRINRRGGPNEPSEWYFWLITEIERNFRPDRLALVLPGFVGRKRLDVKKLSHLKSLSLFEVYRFKNGGIPVQLAIWTQSTGLDNSAHQPLDNVDFREQEYGL